MKIKFSHFENQNETDIDDIMPIVSGEIIVREVTGETYSIVYDAEEGIWFSNTVPLKIELID